MDTLLLLGLGSLVAYGLSKKNSIGSVAFSFSKGGVPYYNEFSYASNRYSVPIRLMIAIADWESGFNPKAINKETEADKRKGRDVTSVGLGQILFPDTAIAYQSDSTLEKLMIPSFNLDIMARLLRDLLKKYSSLDSIGFPASAVAAYNAGSPRYLADGKFVNQIYVDRVREKWIKWGD